MCVSQFPAGCYSSCVPPLPPVPNVIRLQTRLTLDADLDVLNRWYLQYSGTAPTITQLNTLCTNAATLWASTVAKYYMTDKTLVEVIIEDLGSVSGNTGTATVSHAGTEGLVDVPASSCVLLNYTVSRRYRGGKPRVYLPCLGGSDLTNAQTWGGGLFATIAADFDIWLVAIGAAFPSGMGFVGHVSVSYYDGFTVFITPGGRARNISKARVTPLVDLVTSTRANPRVSTQRRRNGRS
jgi:hypothetical protein